MEPTGDTVGSTSGNGVSLAAALEMTLLDGRLRVPAHCFGPAKGDPRGFRTFDDFLHAFERQVAFLVVRVVRAVILEDREYRETLPSPLVSATSRRCSA